MLQTGEDSLDPLPEFQEGVLRFTHEAPHGISHIRKQEEALLIEIVHEFTGDITGVCNTKPLESFQEFEGEFAVIGIAGGDEQGDKTAQGVTDDMKLEAEKPAHGRFASLGKPVTDFVVKDALILTDFQGTGISEVKPRLGGFLAVGNPLNEKDDVRKRLIHQGVKVGVVGDTAQLLGEVGEEAAVVVLDILDPDGKAEDAESKDRLQGEARGPSTLGVEAGKKFPFQVRIHGLE